MTWFLNGSLGLFSAQLSVRQTNGKAQGQRYRKKKICLNLAQNSLQKSMEKLIFQKSGKRKSCQPRQTWLRIRHKTDLAIKWIYTQRLTYKKWAVTLRNNYDKHMEIIQTITSTQTLKLTQWSKGNFNFLDVISSFVVLAVCSWLF